MPKEKIHALTDILLKTIVFILIPLTAEAHVIAGGANGFDSGFLHPLTGPDHFLAMFSVGLWGAQMGGRSVWTLPVTFPLIMVLGGIMGIAGVSLHGVETGIALSIIVLGMAIALAWKPAEWIAIALIAVFAICHGYAHGVELPQAAKPADFAAGFVIATGLIHLVGIGVGLSLNKLYKGKITRGLGGVIVLGGIYYLVS